MVGWQIQVRGNWAGKTGKVWRPAVDGTRNLTQIPAALASTFGTYKVAAQVVAKFEEICTLEDHASADRGYPYGRCPLPAFRIVEVKITSRAYRAIIGELIRMRCEGEVQP